MKTVFYKDFGAVGDGKTDDFSAIKKCHEYANENGCTVKADEGYVYYIGKTDGDYISVKTSVDWTGATFFIDDKVIDVNNKERYTDIFVMESSFDNWLTEYNEDSEIVKKLSSGFKKDIKNIGFAPGYRSLIYVYDKNNYSFNRFGLNGSLTPPPQHEFTIVEPNGDIVDKTEFSLDFTGVTQIKVYRVDDEPITLTGGKFITNANDAPPVYTYYSRGLRFCRSNVTIRDTVHEIIGEGEHGAPYVGFINYRTTHNLRCENLSLQGHKTFYDFFPDGRRRSPMGTYDICGSDSNEIVFYNCTQNNFFEEGSNSIPRKESEYWGIMGTNYCKNIVYDKCLLSRFDAHSGIYNATVRDTTILNIKLTGGGTALIENCTVYENHIALVYLRADYGSTWNGDLIIRNTKYYNETEDSYLVHGAWFNWSFFGTDTPRLPNILIDNLYIKNSKGNNYIYKWTSKNHYFNENHEPIMEDCSGDTIDQPTLRNGTENKNARVLESTVTAMNMPEKYNFIGANDEYVSSKINIKYE